MVPGCGTDHWRIMAEKADGSIWVYLAYMADKHKVLFIGLYGPRGSEEYVGPSELVGMYPRGSAGKIAP